MKDNNYNEVNNRINQLYGNSVQQIKRIEMSKDEKQSIRKTMWILLVLTVVTMICALLILFNPFKKDNYNNITSNNINNELSIGEIDINNKIVQELDKRVEFSALDLYYVDTFEIFRNEVVEINELSNGYKMHFIEKSDAFTSLLMNNGFLEYRETCNPEGLKIPKEEFDKVVKQVLGENTTINGNFKKTVNYTAVLNANLLFTKNGDEYIINCKGELLKNDLSKFPYKSLIKAFGVEDGIELHYKVVFVNENKIYKDNEFNEFIVELTGDNIEDYVEQGKELIYKFSKSNEGSYYLNTIKAAGN